MEEMQFDNNKKPIVALCTTMGIYFLAMLATTVAAGLLFADGMAKADYWQLNVAQLLSSILMFAVPSLIMAREVNGSHGYVWRTNNTLLTEWLLAVAIMLVVQPFVGWCTFVSERVIEMPMMQDFGFEAHSAINAKFMHAMIDFGSIGHWAVAIIVIVIVPAVTEEWFFRGMVQNALQRMTGKTVASVVLSAILFSAMHFESLGFLPRVVLGLVLGFLYAYKGNLWMSITAHVVNNMLVLVQLCFAEKEESIEEVMQRPAEDPGMILPIVSVLLVAYCFHSLYKPKATGA